MNELSWELIKWSYRNKWLNEFTNKWMNELMNKWIKKRINEKMYD